MKKKGKKGREGDSPISGPSAARNRLQAAFLPTRSHHVAKSRSQALDSSLRYRDSGSFYGILAVFVPPRQSLTFI